MQSFGRLLKRLRGGNLPLAELARRTALDEQYLERIEAGRLVTEVVIVRHILFKGFRLERPYVQRLVLGIQLFDLGLRDNDLRQLTVDLITRRTPPRIREQIRALYHRYADREP